MKRLVYTCVFGGYDWVFPPLRPEAGLAYVIVTDDARLRVPGWQTHVVDVGRFRNAQVANRYYKTLAHKVFPDFGYSLYIDGNIRLLGKTSEFIDGFCVSSTCLGIFRHPLRSTVREEAATCLKAGKIAAPERLEAELLYYQQEGFPDDDQLCEAGIILKDHGHPDLDSAMELWWSLFDRFGTRDQLSLPYVIWKTGIPCTYFPGSFRDLSPYFGLYTHRGDRRAPRHYGYVEGRAYDSPFYRGILKAWQLSWTVRRAFRRQSLP